MFIMLKLQLKIVYRHKNGKNTKMYCLLVSIYNSQFQKCVEPYEKNIGKETHHSSSTRNKSVYNFFFVYWDCNLHDLDTRSFLTTYFIVTATSGAGSGPGGGDARRGGDVTPHAQPQRRLIKVDFDNLEVITPSHSPVPFFLRG